MSEFSTTLSLADKARRLAGLARTKRESETESQDQVRLEAQLRKLDVEIVALKVALATHQGLVAAGVPVNKPPDLKIAPRELREQVTRIGRPTWQYLNGRATSVAKSNAAVTDADTEVWHSWALEQVSGLRVALIPRLGQDRRATETRVATLRKLASSAPNLSALAEFQMSLRRVEDDLENVESAGVDAVLDRFVQGRILLSDLSEDELELLKSDNALRAQLYVSLS